MTSQASLDTLSTYDLEYLNQLLGINISSNKTLNAEITLDKDIITQASDLFIAALTIHENLHAVLQYTVRMNDLTTTPDPELYELSITYTKWMKIQGKTNLDEHAFMATMVNEMADSLKTYGESKGYNLLDSYYNDLCWSGKIGYNNQTFIGLPFSKKIAIRKANENERNKADTNGKGKKM